jgi:dephospho-CoA kinase
MLWVGLTGSVGTGKSTVAEILRREGYTVFDADNIAHQVLSLGEKAYTCIVQNFGLEILKPDQSIDRKKLAQKVFNDSQKLLLLESFIHPEVKNRVAEEKQKLRDQNTAIAFYDVPLLFEKQMQADFDYIIVVSCDVKLQRQRLQNRSQWTDKEIDSRLKAQLPIAQKCQGADFVILNNGTIEFLKSEVKKLIIELKKKANVVLSGC